MFDLNNINFHLYYQQKFVDWREIEKNNLNDWYDADSYRFNKETINKPKSDTSKTLKLLNDILEADATFREMIYDERVEK